MKNINGIRPAIYLGIFLVLVLIVSRITLARIEQRTLQSTGNALQAVLNTTEESLLLWQSYQSTFVGDMASNPRLISATEKLLTANRHGDDLRTNPSQIEIRSQFQNQFDRGSILGIFIISPDSINIASMRDEYIGTINLIARQRADLFGKSLRGMTVLVPPIPSNVLIHTGNGQTNVRFPTMFIVAPIIDVAGNTISVLAIRYDPSADFTRITQLGRIGITGETYGFDHDGRLISTSRFDAQLLKIGLIQPGGSGIMTIRITDPGMKLLPGRTPSKQPVNQPLTLMARSAILGERGVNKEGYRDYRGVTVLGAWLWSDVLGIGLTTEIDKSEALLPYYQTRTAIIGLVGLVATLSISLTYLGIVMRRRRERGMLEYQGELEQLVDDRTSKLRAQNETLLTAQSEIKQLSGLLPICSHCKNIRDEDGTWGKIESYIHDHSEADFTHGICDDCAIKYYPGIDFS